MAGLWLGSPLLLSLAVAITLLGQLVGKKEGWSRFDSFYWSFITATTVGYGDISPEATLGRIIVSGEAVVGFFLFAILASMIYRKFQV